MKRSAQTKAGRAVTQVGGGLDARGCVGNRRWEALSGNEALKAVLCYVGYVLQGLELQGELGLHLEGTGEAPRSLRRAIRSVVMLW